MASAMRKMAVYLGLVEDDRYDDDYDEYDIYDDEAADRRRVDRADDESSTQQSTGAPDQAEDRTIGEHFREGTPVIMNLTEMVDSDAKRLVDFAAGLIFGLHGSIERVTNKVFLLSPANVEVTAEDKARMAERGFFNQS
jgi:cell division inhibitor SepF